MSVPTTLTWADLPGLFPGFPGPDRWLPLLERHQRLLEAASARTRVTSVAPEDAVRRHFAESLELLRLTEAHHGGEFTRCVDVGSGGGFPGLVIAIVHPELDVQLVEPLQKRAALLSDVAAALELSNVHVSAARAEDAGRGPLRASANLVTARAVAPLRELLEYTAPFASDGGLLALPKGSGLDDEVTAAAAAMDALGVRLAEVVPMRREVSDNVRVAIFHREGDLAPGFPRRAGTPGKKPL